MNDDAPFTFRADESTAFGHSPSPGAADIAAHHAGLRAGLMNLNRRVAPDGARVVAYASQYEPTFRTDAVHLLWRASGRAGETEDDMVRRLMGATDDELALVITAFIAHHLLAAGAGSGQRPSGLPWVEIAGGDA